MSRLGLLEGLNDAWLRERISYSTSYKIMPSNSRFLEVVGLQVLAAAGSCRV